MRCYADTLGNCTGGISSEHYISRSVLELVGTAVRVSGFPWQPKGERQDIGIGSLAANILCRAHNQQLSSLDDTGMAFVRALKKCYDAVLTGREFSDGSTAINGDGLERWLLKILCGVLVVGKSRAIPALWLDILFRNKAFPENHGLHLFGKPGEASWMFNLLRVISVPDKQGRVAGAKFGIAGIPILLAFGKPDFEDREYSSCFRPDAIEIRKGSVARRIEFEWRADRGGGTMALQLGGPIDPEGQFPVPMVRPD